MLFLTLRRDELETLLENSETRAVGKDGTENNVKQIFVVLFLFFFFSRKRIVIWVVKKKKKSKTLTLWHFVPHLIFPFY